MNVKFVWNCKIWLKSRNLIKVVKFDQNCEILSQSRNLLRIVNLFWNSEIWSILWNIATILKFDQDPGIWLKFRTYCLNRLVLYWYVWFGKVCMAFESKQSVSEWVSEWVSQRGGYRAARAAKKREKNRDSHVITLGVSFLWQKLELTLQWKACTHNCI